jgi:hypothetical protein
VRVGHFPLQLLIASCFLAALLVGCGSGSGGASGSGSGSGSKGATATVTPGVPSGFEQFSASDFRLNYPSDWKVTGAKEFAGEFTGPGGQDFFVLIYSNGHTTQIPPLLGNMCDYFGSQIDSARSVTIGGQQWQQEVCGENGIANSTVEAVVYKSKLFSIAYFSPPKSDFSSDKARFYSVMEQSFAFVN